MTMASSAMATVRRGDAWSEWRAEPGHPPARPADRCRSSCRDDEAIHRGSALTAAIGSTEHPRFSSKSNSTQCTFGGIACQANTPIAQKQDKRVPAFEDVINRLGKVVSSGEFGALLMNVGLKLCDQRLAQLLANRVSLPRRSFRVNLRSKITRYDRLS